MAKFITAREAAELIKDGASIGVAGMGLSGFPEEVVCAIRDRFKQTGHPCALELHQGSAMGDWGVGNSFDGWDKNPREAPLGPEAGVRGLSRLGEAGPGLVAKWSGAHVASAYALRDLAVNNQLESWCLPQGVAVSLWREIAAGRPGLLTKVGLGTFVDPRLEGGRMNQCTKDNIAELVEFGGEEYLYEASFICPQCSNKFKRPVRSFITVHRDGSYRPVGCPECGYYPKENPEDNLRVVCPEIIEWWNYDKNNSHIPEEFTKGATFEAYLTCPDCGMELYTQIKALVETLEDGTVSIRHKGKCRKLRAQKSENNLVKQMPEILEWWNYEKNAPNRPEDYTLYGAASVYLNCPDCGAEFYRRLGDSFSFKDGAPKLLECPICANIKVQAGINDLLTTHPELAKEYSPNNERNVRKIRKGHIYPVKWICPTCSGEYRYLVSERKVGDDVCPYCADRKVLPGYNTFDVRQPALMEEWLMAENILLGISLDEILETSTEKVWWRCLECDYKYLLTRRKRVLKKKRGHNPCPRCNGHRWLQVHFV